MSRLVTFAIVIFAVLSSTAVAQYEYYEGDPSWIHGGPGHAAGAQSASWNQMTPVTPHYSVRERYNIAYDNITADEGWDQGPSLFDEFLKDLSRDSYFQMEYLNYRFKDPDGRGLGAGVQGIADPRSPFPVTIAGQNAGLARVPTLDALKFDNYDGLRALIGVPLKVGTIEASIMWFEDSDERTQEHNLGISPFDPTLPPNFIVTATNQFGQPANNIFLYDNDYRTKSSTDIWGGEINFIGDPLIPAIGFTVSPIIGFRYFDGDEQLQQIGTFDGQSLVAIGGQPLATPLDSFITSATENRYYAPQIGFRAEMRRQRFTLGFEPKLGLGVNVYHATASTLQLRSAGDPLTTSDERGEKLAAVGEFKLYGRIHLTTNFTLSVGYSFIFVDQFSRAYSSLFYNDNGPNAPADIVTRPSFDMFYVQGLNLNAEYKF